MNIHTQRALDRHLGVPICAALSLMEKFRRRKPRKVPPEKILVILLSEMGSLVLAGPMFERLKQIHPEAELHVLLFRKNREILDLLDLVPASNVHTLDDRTLGRLLGDTLRVLRRFKRLKFDIAIDCELFARAGSLFSYLSGARVRVGFHPHTQEGLYRGSHINRPVLYNPYRHISRQFISLACAADSKTTPIGKDEAAFDPAWIPLLDFTNEETRDAIAKLKTDFPGIGDRRLVLVHPSGGVLPIRAWPLEHFVQLCRDLLDDGLAVGIIGMEQDRSLGDQLAARCGSPHCIDLTGYTISIRHLLNLFRHAALLVANDGGPGQFAPLAGLPSIVLFGPETAGLYGPLGDTTHTLQNPLPCSPCLTAYNHRSSPCDGDNQCLKRITPEQVLAKCREILATAPGSASTPATRS